MALWILIVHSVVKYFLIFTIVNDNTIYHYLPLIWVTETSVTSMNLVSHHGLIDVNHLVSHYQL